MTSGIDDSVPRWCRLQAHEAALVTLGVGTALALVVARQGLNGVFFEVLGTTVLYATLLLLARPCQPNRFDQRSCFIASSAFVVWFYCAVERIVPSLGATLRDPALLAMDEVMFGQTPAVCFERVATGWLTDLMSLCYMTYHLYLIVAVAEAMRVLDISSQRLSAYLFTGFAIGFVGYLLVPSVGPGRAYPDLFRAPLSGGTISRLIAEVVAQGSSRYDAFPSLHVLITCILLDHDWREVRRRFWLMVVPSIGLLFSTVYLRYHYCVDILAGVLLFLALRQTILKNGQKKEGSPG